MPTNQGDTKVLFKYINAVVPAAEAIVSINEALPQSEKVSDGCIDVAMKYDSDAGVDSDSDSDSNSDSDDDGDDGWYRS